MAISTHEKQMELIRQEQEREEARQSHLKIMEKGFQVADAFTNREYLDNFSSIDISHLPQQTSGIPDKNKLRIYKITKIVFDQHEDINDKLTSVYNALYNLSISVAVYIIGNQNEVEFFIGVRSENIAPLAGKILESTLESNFPGINLSYMEDNKISDFINRINKTQEGISMLK